MEMESEEKGKVGEGGDDLPRPWRRVHSAVWLIGLAILAWKGWWWPGILVLVAISGLVEAGISLALGRSADNDEQAQALTPPADASWLPSTCPHCGAPLSVQAVRWTGPRSADCPYCNSHLKAERGT